MSLIELSDLSFTYEGSSDPVFEQVSCRLDTDWRLGLIGRNGRGKTTLLRLLTGGLEYTGTIVSHVMFDYFPYPVSEPERMAYQVLEDLPGSSSYEFWQLQREMDRLKLPEEVLYRPFQTLSHGEQTKLLLAALFLQEGHFLLIDEPTNHLDGEGRRLVSQYLSRKKGFLLVSHDRAFLDGCVDHVLAFNRSGLEVQKGNFSSWYENKKRQDASELAQQERLKKDIRRLQTAARQSGAWADQSENLKIGRHPIKEETFIGTRAYLGEKSRKMQQRRKNLERRQQQAISEKEGLLKDLETAEALKLFPLRGRWERLAVLEQVSMYYGETPLRCGFLELTIRPGERIALQGGNGCGKSSLLRLILQAAGASGNAGSGLRYEGRLWTAAGMKISWVPQDASFLTGSLRAYAAACGIEESLFFALLRKLDFSREQLEKPMESFSQGQKKKVLIARSLCEQAHLYIWDEPFNYIDLYSRMQIEDLILKFCPTMLFVEHDEAFVRKVATRVVPMGQRS